MVFAAEGGIWDKIGARKIYPIASLTVAKSRPFSIEPKFALRAPCTPTSPHEDDRVCPPYGPCRQPSLRTIVGSMVGSGSLFLRSVSKGAAMPQASARIGPARLGAQRGRYIIGVQTARDDVHPKGGNAAGSAFASYARSLATSSTVLAAPSRPAAACQLQNHVPQHPRTLIH